MFSKTWRVVKFLTVFLVVIALVTAAAAYALPRRSFPQVRGEVRLAGLQGPVEVYRDEHGIPHVYAASTSDLFFAQGYLHAQDRFWQMDFWRHVGSGRLAELFGESQVDTDRFLRTLGWARVSRQELAELTPEARAVLEAYAAGVNAYLGGRSKSSLSLEYSVLGLINASYQPEPWDLVHTLTFARLMAWDLAGNMDSEIERAILLGSLSPEQLAELYPPYPSNYPVIVTATGAAWNSAADAALLDGLPGLPGLLDAAAGKVEALHALLGGGGEGMGSNSWVLAGSRTSSGAPLLANDPHLSEQIPSIWYEMGLHCQPVSESCPFNVTGFSFASAPGVVIGHNSRIAWGLTNLGPDVQDLYIERIHPEDPLQYEHNGQWVSMEVVNETIQVSGGQPVEVQVRYTRHGPIISDVYGPLKDFSGKAGLDLPQGTYALALRWNALDPMKNLQAILGYNLAGSWEEFRRALEDFNAASQNFVYADVEGNIGYQSTGNIPIRAGGNGWLPVPGWTDEYDWQGFIPFAELPSAFNPPEGYIATANNPVAGRGYPHLLGIDWDYGQRARRVVDLIEAAPGPIDLAYVQQMQGDNLSMNAARLVPLLLQVPVGDARLEQAREVLQGWDYQAHLDSPAAALFEVFWSHLLRLTFSDDLPERYMPSGGNRWYVVAGRLVEQPNSAWWDRQDTPEVEDRDEIFRQALAAAVSELEQAQGGNPARWNWGGLHNVVFSNPSFGRSGPDLVRGLFNRGPYRASGGSGIINATSWNAASVSYRVSWLPSMRMIVDLGSLDSSWTVLTTGQSGHAYHPNYIDQAEDWQQIRYHPQLWERSQVEGAAKAKLTLLPAP
jgi:penicillin G amidase